MIGEITTWFGVGAIGMAAGTVAFVWGGLSQSELTRKYYITLAAISGIATVAYGLMAVGIGWHPVGERTVFLPRYVDWLLTTPLLLLYLGMLVDVERRTLWWLIGLDVVMIGTGTIAALMSGTERFALFVVGGAAFVGIVYLLVGPMSDRATGHSTEPVFYSLRNVTVVLWSVYPIIWILGPSGLDLLTALVDVLLITYLDLITKVGFGLIALNASVMIGEEMDTTLVDPAEAD